MNLDEYQRLALRTANIATYTEREIFTNACLGLIGETGEVADIFKKTMFQGHTLAPVHLVKELGDVMWYAALAVFSQKGDYGFSDAAEAADDFFFNPSPTLPSEMTVFAMAQIAAGLSQEGLTGDQIITRCGQIVKCVEALAVKHGSTLSAVMAANIAKLENRYPGAKFDAERSQHRKDGDI